MKISPYPCENAVFVVFPRTLSRWREITTWLLLLPTMVNKAASFGMILVSNNIIHATNGWNFLLFINKYKNQLNSVRMRSRNGHLEWWFCALYERAIQSAPYVQGFNGGLSTVLLLPTRALTINGWYYIVVMLLCWSSCLELCLRCCNFRNKVGIAKDSHIHNSWAPRSLWLESHLRRRDWAWSGDIDSNKYWMVAWSLWETTQCRSFSSRLWSGENNLVESHHMNDTINLDFPLKTTCSLLRRL